MDRLEGMRLFVRVTEMGSFAAVAQQMNVARSVVTRQVAALESYLGTKLLARSTRRLSLTSAGASYLEKCREILNLVEAAETDLSEARQAPRGHIRMTLPLSFGIRQLMPMFGEFLTVHPDISLEPDRGWFRPGHPHRGPARSGRCCAQDRQQPGRDRRLTCLPRQAGPPSTSQGLVRS